MGHSRNGSKRRAAVSLRNRASRPSWPSGGGDSWTTRHCARSWAHRAKWPCRFGELLEVDVVVEKVGRKAVTYRFDFRRDGADVATGRVSAVFCRTPADAPLEALEIPDDVRAKLLQ